MTGNLFSDLIPASGGALTPYAAPPASAPPFTAAQIAAMMHDGIPGNGEAAQSALTAWMAAHPAGAVAPPVAHPVTPPPATTPPATTPGTPATPAPTASGAWDTFRNSTNYQWRFDQGQAAVEGSAAARGVLDSGAEKKAVIEYGQNFASNELSNYMNLLAGQQSMGVGALGAVTGAGTNYGSQVGAGNTAAANAAANAALQNGNAQAGLWGSIGRGVGMVGGTLSQYGMRAPTSGGYGGYASTTLGNAGAPAPYLPGGLNSSNYTPTPWTYTP